MRIAIGVALLLFILLGLQRLNKDFLLWWNVNEVIVKVDEPLSREKVKVMMRHPALPSQLVVYGEDAKEKIPHEYGENNFTITYNNEYIVTFRHFKLNRRHQHSYHFYLSKSTPGILLGVFIDGTDKKEFQREMSKI